MTGIGAAAMNCGIPSLDRGNSLPLVQINLDHPKNGSHKFICANAEINFGNPKKEDHATIKN
jgi:hypothetical protein